MERRAFAAPAFATRSGLPAFASAFLPGAFAVRLPEPVSLDLPEAWRRFALPAGYICPMCAQLALIRGWARWVEAGRLRIGGPLLMGRAGSVFGFTSTATAARWVQINQDRAALELAALARLTPAEAVVWRAKRRAALDTYAQQIINQAAKQPDAIKRAALIAEANFARAKWAD